MSAPLSQTHQSSWFGESETPHYIDVPLVDVDDSMVQGELFTLEATTEDDIRGYRGAVAALVAGITYRQLDYWANKQIVTPSVANSHGSGSRRLYNAQDVVMLAVAKQLLDLGMHLHDITQAIDYMAHCSVDHIAHMTLWCDGKHIRECQRDDTVASMMHGGEEAIYILALNTIYERIMAALATQPCVVISPPQRTQITYHIAPEWSMPTHVTIHSQHDDTAWTAPALSLFEEG